MKVSGLSIKQLVVLLVLIISVVAIVAACSRSSGGDDGGGPIVVPPPPEPPVIPLTPITFRAPQEVSSNLSAALATKALAEEQQHIAAAFGMGSRPGGFASRLGKAPSTGDIGKVNPDLATLVEKMKAFAQSGMIQKAVRNVAAAKALRAPVNDTLAAGFCDNADGQIQIQGTNNYDVLGADPLVSTYKITFTKCRDDVLATELSGELTNIEVTESIAATAVTSNMTVEITESQFTDETYATMTNQTRLSGTFVDKQDTTGEISATGFFATKTLATANTPEQETAYAYSSLAETRVDTINADQTTTSADTLNGQFTFTKLSGGATNFQITMQATNLEDETHFLANGSRENSLNGTIGIAWTPAQAACQAGQMTITTTALRTLAAESSCPSSGVVTVNNSTITYGTAIQVSVDNNTSISYANCAAFDATGAVCASN